MYFIYLFTNKQNGKVYVGKTNDIARRNREHLSESKNNENGHFYNAIRKYGFENFEREILYECENEDETYQMEEYFITKYQSNDKTRGYNSTIGGDGLRGATEETRKKMSENAKLRIGKKNGFFGRKCSEEHKRKISEANSKITMEQVRELRTKFLSGHSRKSLQEQYGLSQQQVSKILLNQAHKENA